MQISAFSISFCAVNYEIFFLFQKIGLIQFYLEGLWGGEELRCLLCQWMQRTSLTAPHRDQQIGQVTTLYWALGHFSDMGFFTYACYPYIKSCSGPHQSTSSGRIKCFKYIFSANFPASACFSKVFKSNLAFKFGREFYKKKRISNL